MKRLRRALPVLTAIIATWAITITSVGAAQSSIPDGVFVRDVDGVVWLVLGGQRVNLAIWGASQEEIAALPRSDRWATMNDAGAIVAGDRPVWFAGQEAPTGATDAPVASTRSAPTATPTLVPTPSAPSSRLGEPALLTSNSGTRLLVTAHRVRDDVKSTNQFSKPEGRYVVVEWSVKNDGQANFDFRSSHLKLLTVDDFIIEREFVAGLPEPDLDSGVVGPGQTVRGFLPYDVPKDQKLKSAIFHGSGSPQILIADLTR